jgi:hypothetical protein
MPILANATNPLAWWQYMCLQTPAVPRLRLCAGTHTAASCHVSCKIILLMVNTCVCREQVVHLLYADTDTVNHVESLTCYAATCATVSRYANNPQTAVLEHAASCYLSAINHIASASHSQPCTSPNLSNTIHRQPQTHAHNVLGPSKPSVHVSLLLAAQQGHHQL